MSVSCVYAASPDFDPGSFWPSYLQPVLFPPAFSLKAREPPSLTTGKSDCDENYIY